MGKIFFQALKTFGLLDKVGGITVDNASVNNIFFVELAKLMEDQRLDFDETFCHFQCLAHILNLGVQDTMKFFKFRPLDEEEEKINNDGENNVREEQDEVGDLLDQYLEEGPKTTKANEITNLLGKVRIICKEIKYSGDVTADLGDFCKAFKLAYVKPVLDCKTRWNSSLKMLEFFQKLKPAIHLLYDNNQQVKEFKLKDIEWKAIDLMVTYLQIFKEASDLLSAEKYPTLPMAVMAIDIVLDNVERTVFA